MSSDNTHSEAAIRVVTDHLFGRKFESHTWTVNGGLLGTVHFGRTNGQIKFRVGIKN